MLRPNLISKSFTLTACLAIVAATMGCSQQGDQPGQLSMTPLLGVQAAAPMPDGQVRVDVEAQVTLVQDPGSFLGGAISVGDDVSGYYVYNENAADSKPGKPEEGKYLFNGPFGMNLELAGLTFASDPLQVKMEIRLKNDITKGNPPGPKDFYEVKSRNNLDVLSGLGVKDIKIKLEDHTGTALSGIELLGFVLDFNAWQSRYLLTIKGTDGWKIEAQIVSISPSLTGQDSHDHSRGLNFHQL